MLKDVTNTASGEPTTASKRGKRTRGPEDEQPPAAAGGKKAPLPKFDVESFVLSHHDTSMEHYVLGIDEAGRGPVMGPMVYTGGIIQLSEHDKLVATGAADSKVLTADDRNKILVRLRKLETFHDFTKSLSPEAIADCMTGKSAQSLNTLSHQTAVKIIYEATMHCEGKLRAVFIDTVGRPEPYEAAVKRRFPHLIVIVRPKADAIYPVVSAASIVAKTTRDKAIADLGVDVGSGYPSDPAASKFLRKHMHKFFGYTNDFPYVRHSWGPVKSLTKRACVPVTFEKDLQDDGEDTKQQKISFKRQDTRDVIYQHVLGLGTVDGEDEVLDL